MYKSKFTQQVVRLDCQIPLLLRVSSIFICPLLFNLGIAVERTSGFEVASDQVVV